MVFLAGILLHTQVATPTMWRLVEKTALLWGPGHPAYTVVIDEPVRPLSSVDTWQRMRIRTPTGRLFTTRITPGPLVAVKAAVLDTALVRDNAARSAYLYLSPKLRGVNAAPMLFLFGQPYASDPGSLTILTLDGTGFPVEIFNSAAFELTGILDLDGDHVPEVVGTPSLSQCGGCGHCSYDPFAVYRLAATKRATYQLALSRRYNEAHYVWAGPKASEHIDVDMCDPAKPHFASRAPR